MASLALSGSTSGQITIAPPAVAGTNTQTLQAVTGVIPVITSTGAIVNSGPFYVNSLTVSTSYSIPSGSSAMSAGPITVNSGVTVTVPSGSKWVVL
jgi:hypothetical protein